MRRASLLQRTASDETEFDHLCLLGMLLLQFLQCRIESQEVELVGIWAAGQFAHLGALVTAPAERICVTLFIAGQYSRARWQLHLSALSVGDGSSSCLTCRTASRRWPVGRNDEGVV